MIFTVGCCCSSHTSVCPCHSLASSPCSLEGTTEKNSVGVSGTPASSTTYCPNKNLYIRPGTTETRCFHKKLEFQRYPPKDFCTARYERKSSKKKFQTFQKTRKKSFLGRSWAKIGLTPLFMGAESCEKSESLQTFFATFLMYALYGSKKLRKKFGNFYYFRQ